MSLLNKLIRVEYEMSIFKKSTNELIETLDLKATIEVIKLIANDKQNFSTCDGLLLNIEQLNSIKIFIDKHVSFNLVQYDYYLIEGGLYNW